MNKLEIVSTTEIPSHERASAEIEIAKTFVDNGKNKPFTNRENGADAFTDNDDGTITSSHDSPAIAQSMVKLALSKGAEFKPSGTDTFVENIRFAMEQEQEQYDTRQAEQQQSLDFDSHDARASAPAQNVKLAKTQSDDKTRNTDNEVTGTSDKKTDDDAEIQRRRALAKKVVNAYVVDGNRYMTRGDKSREVFRDNGTTIKSKLDDERTVQNAIDLMASRGVTSIKVSGTKTFSRNAWIAAQAHDMTVTGYKPTAQDLAMTAKPDNTITDTNQENQQPIQRPKGELSGKLMEHGKAPYQHNPDNNTSYYVKISNNGNEQTQWGVGLESAVAKSGVQTGDNVTLRRSESNPVSLQNGQHAARATWVIDAAERHEQSKAAIIRAAGAAVAKRVSDPSDVDRINDMISQRVDSHDGPLPDVPIYRTERQAQAVQQDEQQQELTL